jgi:hypothetical protein
MAGPTSYPDNLATRVTALERLVERLLYSSQATEPYTRLVAGEITVGNDSPGRRIIFNPANSDPGAAEIRFLPQGVSDSNPAKISVEQSGTYSGEAVVTVTSGASLTASTRFRQASGEIFMQVLDETGNSDNGGYAYWGRTHAQFGFINGTANNYYNFSSNNVSRHFGQWDDFGDLPSNAGQLWGSVTITGSGSTGGTISYASTMDSTMGPIFGLRTGSGSPNTRWSITFSSTSGVTVEWDTAQSVALYMLSFRH